MKNMTNAQRSFLVAAIYETFFAVPILGWIVYSGAWGNFILISLVIHIIALILANQEKASVTGSMVGILAGAFAVIPVLGWMVHVIAAVLNYLQVFEVSINNQSNFNRENKFKEKNKSKKEDDVKDAEIE